MPQRYRGGNIVRSDEQFKAKIFSSCKEGIAIHVRAVQSSVSKKELAAHPIDINTGNRIYNLPDTAGIPELHHMVGPYAQWDKEAHYLVGRVNVGDRIKRVEFVYKELQKISPLLPELNFPCPATTAVIQTEQCKALTDEVRVKPATLLLRLDHCGCVLGAALMLTVGMRTSEAAAVRFSDIHFDGNNASLPVLRHLNSDGDLVEVLKTESSYRVLPLPSFMLALIKERKKYLAAQGYSETDISNMPFVAADNDPPVCKGRKPFDVCQDSTAIMWC